jgi:hypothetical protein
MQHDRLPIADATDGASRLPMVVPVMVLAVRGVMSMAVVVTVLVVTMMVVIMVVVVMIVAVMSLMLMPVMAMFLVIMPMVMPMMMVMMVIMVIMPVVVIMTVTMMMRMLMRRGVAVVGLERRRHRLRLEPAFLQQSRDLRRVGDAQPVGENLHRHMAVTERKDEPRPLGEILLAHLEHRLDLGDDLDQPAVVEQQEVVGAKERRRREIEFDASALAAEHEALLLDAVLVFEQHGIDDVALGFSGANDFLGAWHGMIRFSDASGARLRRAWR